MRLISKQCSNANCTNPVWSGGKCQNHVSKKKIKSNSFTFRTSKEGYRQINLSMKELLKKEQTFERHKLFREIWNKRGYKSEISNEKIYSEISSAYFHHILPKNKYPGLDLKEDNIIIMTMDEHANVESDMYRYEEVNERRKLLEIKYKIHEK